MASYFNSYLNCRMLAQIALLRIKCFIKTPQVQGLLDDS